MAYSRWQGSSNWYTFWNVAVGGKTKDEQAFSAWFCGALNLLDLRLASLGKGTDADIEAAVKLAANHYENQGLVVDDLDRDRLRQDLRAWFDDMQERFLT